MEVFFKDLLIKFEKITKSKFLEEKKLKLK